MSGTGAPVRRKVAAERVAAHRHGRALPLAAAAELTFGDEGLAVPGVLEVSWGQVAVADVKVRDHGQRLQLSLGSGDHGAFDFLRTEMPMSPEAAELLQLLHARKVRTAELPALLLSWPCSGLYGGVCSLPEALLAYEVVNTTLEMLFGFMLLTSLGRISTSYRGGILKSLRQLGSDLSELFGRGLQLGGSLLGPLRVIVGEESAALAAAELGLTFTRTCFSPVWLLLGLVWHISDFASDFLLVLLLLQHLLTFGYFLSRVVSTVRAVLRFLTKAFGLVRRGVARAKGD
mmetsp:Transcript_33377/g.103613  ORF Transcript_33377/g.103613 Transcript_33377/m.103613 type:complete len:289 (+) Transcript_33377:41-907(+)